MGLASPTGRDAKTAIKASRSALAVIHLPDNGSGAPD
jgi:hypothetical protein